MTQPILLSIRADPYNLPFSLDFYTDFFRRYPADSVLFASHDYGGNCPFGATVYNKDAGESVAPDWVLASPMLEGAGQDPVFYNRRTKMWSVPSSDKTWRTDPRIHALVEEMGIQRASGPETRLAFEILPAGVEWTIREMTDYEDVETVTWTIPWQTIVADLLGPASAHPRSVLTARLLAGSTPESLRADLERDLEGL